MASIEDAKTLLSEAQSDLADLDGLYQSSLADLKVEPRLLVLTKRIIDNVRSALDYVAYAVVKETGGDTKRRIYFPYVEAGSDEAEFSGRLEGNLPGIAVSNPKLASAIRTIQPIDRASDDWLPKLAALSNDNKHKRLSPQTKRRRRSLRIETGGAAIELGPGASIQIGSGVSIQMGDVTIAGGQTISGDQPAVVRGPAYQMVTEWVLIRFEETGDDVLDLLRRSVQGSTALAAEVESLLDAKSSASDLTWPSSPSRTARPRVDAHGTTVLYLAHRIRIFEEAAPAPNHPADRRRHSYQPPVSTTSEDQSLHSVCGVWRL